MEGEISTKDIVATGKCQLTLSEKPHCGEHNDCMAIRPAHPVLKVKSGCYQLEQ